MIKVGMMVEIIQPPDINEPTRRELQKFLGHTGRVIGKYPAHSCFPERGIRYEIEGADPERYAFSEPYLRIIDEKDANTVVSFESLKEATGWAPRETA